MAHVDRVADKPWFLASFFSGGTKTGLFEAIIVSLGSLAIVILAAYMPSAIEVVAAP